MTIIIIIACCWILYKTGKAAAMLEYFKLYEPAPTPAPARKHESPQRKPPAKAKSELPTLERLQSERIAFNILCYNQVENAADLVERLSDTELKNIIDRFMNDLEV